MSMTKVFYKRFQNIKLGVFYGIISTLSFSIMSVFIKKIGDDLPTSLLIFSRFEICFLLLLPWVIRNHNFSLKVSQPIRFTSAILTALLALSCFFLAVKFLPLVDALLLNNTIPLFVPIFAWLMIGSNISKKSSIGLVFGFLGIIIILHPGREIYSSTSLIALLSGILAALSIVQMRLISRTSSTLQILFYYSLLNSIVSGLVALWQWQLPQNLTAWLLLLGIGVFGTLSLVFSTLSYVTAPVRIVSSMIFLTVVFGGFFDWLLWGNIPNFLTIIGAIFAISGTIITVYFSQAKIVSQNKNEINEIDLCR